MVDHTSRTHGARIPASHSPQRTFSQNLPLPPRHQLAPSTLSLLDSRRIQAPGEFLFSQPPCLFQGARREGFTGQVDEACIDYFDNIFPHASFWPRNIIRHKPTFQQAVLACYEADKKLLGKILPTLAKKDCRVFIDTPFLTGAAPTEEEEDEIQPAIASFEASLQAIAAPPCNSIDTNQDTNGFETLSQLTPRTRGGNPLAGPKNLRSPRSPQKLHTASLANPFLWQFRRAQGAFCSFPTCGSRL